MFAATVGACEASAGATASFRRLALVEWNSLLPVFHTDFAIHPGQFSLAIPSWV